MYQEDQEDSLWRIYLSSPFREESYNDWKDKLIESSKSKDQVEKEAIEAAEEALAILDLMSGGDVGGI